MSLQDGYSFLLREFPKGKTKPMQKADSNKEKECMEISGKIKELITGQRLRPSVHAEALSNRKMKSIGTTMCCPGCGSRNTFWSATYQDWACLNCDLLFHREDALGNAYCKEDENEYE